MSQQKLDQCISECRQVVSEIQNLTDQAKDRELKSTLNESAHHLEMCIHECEFAKKQAP